MKQSPSPQDLDRLFKLLEGHRRNLAEAGGDEGVLNTYGMLVRYLSRLPRQQLLKLISTRSETVKPSGDLPLKDVQNYSLEKIRVLLGRPDVPRKILEAIAVGRFHFPKGSLRALSNLEILRAKILTMIENERSHQTIHAVAKRSAKAAKISLLPKK